jgi:hypothetical protein
LISLGRLQQHLELCPGRFQQYPAIISGSPSQDVKDLSEHTSKYREKLNTSN